MFKTQVYVLSWALCATLASWAGAQAPSGPTAQAGSREASQAVWLGFANEAGSLAREAELRARCGDFKRVYVPPATGNKFTDLCSQEGRTCEKVCDWEGRVLPCNAVSQGGRRDGSRIALCRLTVGGSPQTTRLDQNIVSDINAKLWQDQTLKTLDIRVTSKNGVVTLAGTVNSELEKAAAERLAKSENGVQQVTNQLTVPNDEASVRGAIRRVDFLNFDYPSDCWEHFDGFGKVIHVSNGQWTKEDIGGFAVGKRASEWMVSYGDLKGDGQDEAVVVTSCQGLANFDYEEIFVFEMSAGSPRLLARLSPLDWGKGEEGNGGMFQISEVHVNSHQLRVSFYAGGSHASPAWIDTATFQWVGNRLVRTRLDRRPFKP
jgi:hypothetical protein